MSRTKGSFSKHATPDTKLEIVNKHFDEGKTFRELEFEYPYSYAAIRKWCLDYEIHGKEGLISNTGKGGNNGIRINNKDPKNQEIAKLRKDLKKKEMEIAFLKKLNELME